MNILAFLVVGLIAGLLAGALMGGRYGLIGSTLMGILGAFVGGFALDVLNVVITSGSTFLNAVITALIGAIIVIVVGRLLTEPNAV